jgi:hypothetical protein
MENSLFETKEQYLEMRTNFKKWYNSEERKSFTAEDFALYACIRGKDWRKCFAPNSDEQTIERIERYLTKTKTQYLFLDPYICIEPYNKTVTPEMIELLRNRGIQKWGE